MNYIFVHLLDNKVYSNYITVILSKHCIKLPDD